MEIKLTQQENITTAHLIGRLDTPASQEISQNMDELQAAAAHTLILDCSELEYISSSGLRIFLTLRKTAASKGGKVIIKSISPVIRQVFMMTGFLNLFEIQN